MNYNSVCLIIALGCTQALASEEESQDLSNLLSSAEDSEDIIVANNKEGASSEENSKESYGPKKDIEESLKNIFFADDASDDKDFDAQEVNKHVSENGEESEEEKKEKEETSDIPKESESEPGNIIGSYVLWRPYILDYTSILQAEQDYYKSMVHIREFLERGFSTEEDEEKENLGWKDDAKQLDLPSRVAALTSSNEPDLYDNIADSFHNLKETLNEAVSRPEVKDNMFYILIGLTGFLMLALFNDNICKKQEARTVQDHYLLPDSGASAKLPTYEECVKADKNILVNIGDNEALNKVDLNLPVFVVEKDGQQRTNRE